MCLIRQSSFFTDARLLPSTANCSQRFISYNGPLVFKLNGIRFRRFFLQTKVTVFAQNIFENRRRVISRCLRLVKTATTFVLPLFFFFLHPNGTFLSFWGSGRRRMFPITCARTVWGWVDAQNVFPVPFQTVVDEPGVLQINDSQLLSHLSPAPNRTHMNRQILGVERYQDKFIQINNQSSSIVSRYLKKQSSVVLS